MIIVMSLDSTDKHVNDVISRLEMEKISYNIEKVGLRTLILLAVNKDRIDEVFLANYPGVESLANSWASLPIIGKNYLEQREYSLKKFNLKEEKPIIIAGPCAVESRDQVFDIAKHIHDKISLFRGGAYKPRTSPYSFQGMGKDALKYLKDVKEKFSVPVVSEVMSQKQLEEAYDYLDVIQIGARNMQNFELLKEVGAQEKAVILKRGLSATIEEWLNAAEYIATRGNENIILCERGIRTFSKDTRNTLDLSSVPIVKSRTHLPVIVDPSHATGYWSLVEPMALAAIAAGADGLMIEVHNAPDKALSDGDQSLKLERFNEMHTKVEKLYQLMMTF